ncbi:MAG: hypothetical protein ACYDCO_17630 [Armatimonadota bacterium]
MIEKRNDDEDTAEEREIGGEAFEAIFYRARLGLACFLAAELLILAMVALGDGLEARRPAWVIPPFLINLLHLLAAAVWMAAVFRFARLLAAWPSLEYRRRELIGWSGAAFGILACLPLVMLPAVRPLSPARLADTCMANQRRIIFALVAHETPEEPFMPLHWTAVEALKGQPLICPATQRKFHARGGYGYNFHLAGRRISEISAPARTVMVADSVEPGMLLMTIQDIDQTRHLADGRRGFVCGFVDGHVEFCTMDTMLTWK